MADKKNTEMEKYEKFKKIDINYVNHEVMFLDNVPAYVLGFAFLFMFAALIRSITVTVVITATVYVLFTTAIKLYKNNESFGTLWEKFRYIYKPMFYFLKPEVFDTEKSKKKKK